MQTKVSKWKLDTGTMHIFFLCQGSVAPYNSVQCLAPTALPKTQSFGHRCFQFFSPGWAPVSPLQRLLGTFALSRSASDQWHARSRKSHHADLGTEGCGNLGFCGGWRGLLPRLPGAWDIFPSLSFYPMPYSFHTCQAHAIHAIQAITCHYMPYTSSTNAVLHPFFMAISWVFIGFYHESRSRTGMHSMWSMCVFLGFSWQAGLRLQSWCNVFHFAWSTQLLEKRRSNKGSLWAVDLRNVLVDWVVSCWGPPLRQSPACICAVCQTLSILSLFLCTIFSFGSVPIFKVRLCFGKWRPRSAVSTGFAKLVAINVNEFCNIIATAGAVQAGMGCAAWMGIVWSTNAHHLLQ